MAVAGEPAPSRFGAVSNGPSAPGDNQPGVGAGETSKQVAEDDKKRPKDKKKTKCNNKNATKENKAKKVPTNAAAIQQNKDKKMNTGDEMLVDQSCPSTNDDRQAKLKLPLVEELKLFQNNNLLNQQDPIQQLQAQLNELIRNDDASCPVSIPNQHQQPPQISTTSCLSTNEPTSNTTTNHVNGISSLENSINIGIFENEGDNSFTVKKGVLWQQQNYEKLHQRLFSRWKKRFFILTTGYLVCFKRSTCKVGRSEMGKFLYKTSLSDVTKIEWLKPKKSDKGAIILHLNGRFNLHLWSKQNLDEWMFMIKESVDRNKIRRATCLGQVASDGGRTTAATTNAAAMANSKNGNEQPTQSAANDNLYENTAANQRLINNHANGILPAATLSGNTNNGAVKGEEEEELISRGNSSINRGNVATNLGKENHLKTESSSPSIEAAQRRSQEKLVNRMEGKADVTSSMTTTTTTTGKGKTDEQSSTSSPPSRTKLESDRANVIERKSSKDNTGEDPANGNKVDIFRASRKGRKPPLTTAGMINDDDSSPKSKEDGKGRGTRLNDSSASSSSSSPSSGSALASAAGRVGRSSQKSDRATGEQISSVADCHPPVPKDRSDCSGVGKPNWKSSSTRRRGSSDADNDTCNLASESTSHKNEVARGSQRIAGELDLEEQTSGAGQVRPVGQRLIRRDDSWQSLVSLARVGKAVPTAVQVAQRSLYAQHIMPHNGDHLTGRQQQQQTINIESSVTPIRRHQSIQSTQRSRLFSGLQTSSLDLPNPPAMMMAAATVAANQAAQVPQAAPTSYQQKLLQLQLLHNSNNVDYIRNNGGNDTNDYQVYASSSNYYGYSSMRSNLKSAASEFSFIRPFSANRNQSTLPHQHHQQQLFSPQQQLHARSSFNGPPLPQPPPGRSSGGGGGGGIPMISDGNNNSVCLTPLTKQFLVNPTTGERIINQGALVPGGVGGGGGLVVGVDLASASGAPMRELPLKPNKKRQSQNGHSANLNAPNHLPKSSSLTSSIACFFRRAFSRRSKKGSKKRSRLAGSCSSSLGAFEGGVSVVVPVVPSAFSTGSKSVDGHINKDFNNNNNNTGNTGNNGRHQQQQSQRMVDMIEAFTNRALPSPIQSGNNNNNGDQIIRSSSQAARQYNPLGNLDFNAAAPAPPTPRLPPAPPTPSTPSQHFRRSLNGEFGSPMHKSNSICATMGLSLIQNNNTSNRRNGFLQQVDGELMGVSCDKSRSPMLMRSSKVMSAHLTPLMLQRESSSNELENQFILSPRNSSRLDQMPRPSSIYGQPSMISSPTSLMSRDEQSRQNFGAHRNSLHNHQFRDNAGGFEIRRYNQMMKAPYLDTTREVAEELASPNGETPSHLIRHHDHHHHQQQQQQQRQELHDAATRDNQSPQCAPARYLMKRDHTFDVLNSSPGSGRWPHQAAVVNPILQSPTMDAIYDNHPMLSAAELSAYSHYDNHQSPSVAQARFGQVSQMSSSKTSQFIVRQDYHQPNSLEDHYSSQRLIASNNNNHNNNNNNIKAQSHTPMRQSRLIDSAGAEKRLPTVADMMISNRKPSAIVAPSTPNHNTDRTAQNPQSSPLIQSRSPMMPRRVAHLNHHHNHQQQQQQSHYQQSPLVSQQTRVLSKPDGIQATIIGGGGSGGDGHNFVPQPAVSIAGAPGISLEPSLAASLLRGTNIDAYESSTFGRGASFDESQQLNSKTFLVATRLSKSIASSQSSSNYNGSAASSVSRDETSELNANGEAGLIKQAKDGELSAASSSSRSASSSSGGRRSLRAKRGYGDNKREERLDYSDSQGNKGSLDAASHNNNNNNNRDKYNPSMKTRPNGYNQNSALMMQCEKESSSKPSEGTSVSQISNLDKEIDDDDDHVDVDADADSNANADADEQRNWITSKLVE